jgi:hypothetical protein
MQRQSGLSVLIKYIMKQKSTEKYYFGNGKSSLEPSQPFPFYSRKGGTEAILGSPPISLAPLSLRGLAGRRRERGITGSVCIIHTILYLPSIR